MQKSFDTLIQSFIDNNVGVADDFLSIPLAKLLKENLLALYANGAFLAAGTGNNSKFAHHKSVRSDKIYWLDRKHENEQENLFFDLIDKFVHFLNSSCYTGITGYEFHYAIYEKDSFYKKHLDQFQTDKSRAFSMIMYLNSDWEKKDGGELGLHHAEGLQMISPQSGKCVFFKSSEIAHEVFVTNQPRLSITGWLKTN